MGKKGGSAPEAPDPYQTASNEAAFNRVDTYGSNGSGVRYGYTDASGNFQPGIAPEGFQSAVSNVEGDFDRQMRKLLEPASSSLVNRVITDNIDNLPDAARVQDRGTVAQDIFDRNMSLIQPQLDRSENRLLTRLQSRGIPIGSEAFNESYGAQTREVQDMIARLAQDANVAAGAEQSRQFALDAGERSNSIAELVAAMGGGYAPATALPTGAAPSVNYSGLVNSKYQADLANWQADRQASAQTASALGGLGGALLMKCTETAKHVDGHLNREFAATAVSRLGLFAWRYRDGEAPDGDHAQHIGPMAEQFHDLTGLGNDKTISVIDMLGLAYGAMQHMMARMSEQQAEIRTLTERLAQVENHVALTAERIATMQGMAEAHEARLLRKVS